MSDFDSRWRDRTGRPARSDSGWGVWAAIAAVVAVANVATGGEAITHRAVQAEAIVDAAVALVRCQAGRLAPCATEEKVAEAPEATTPSPRCRRTVRMRRGPEGWPSRVVVRRRCPA